MPAPEPPRNHGIQSQRAAVRELRKLIIQIRGELASSALGWVNIQAWMVTTQNPERMYSDLERLERTARPEQFAILQRAKFLLSKLHPEILSLRRLHNEYDTMKAGVTHKVSRLRGNATRRAELDTKHNEIVLFANDALRRNPGLRIESLATNLRKDPLFLRKCNLSHRQLTRILRENKHRLRGKHFT